MPYYRAVAPAAAATPDRIGVLLVNLGTPDSPTYFAVQRYLREFLGDRRVINTSRWIWLPILYGIVLPLPAAHERPQVSQDLDAGGLAAGGVLRSASRRKIERRLQETLGDRVRVALGMTYGNPSIDAAIEALAEQNVKRLLVLPLYPQYCSSTTGSVFDRTSRYPASVGGGCRKPVSSTTTTRIPATSTRWPGAIDEHWASAGDARI